MDKIAKGKNFIHGNFVKKMALNMKVFSQDAVVLKTDAKLTKAEKDSKDSLDKKFKNKL